MARTTPRSHDLMPEVLELLKRNQEMKKKDIRIHMERWIKQHGFDDRERSIGWALNRLEKENYVSHPRTGTWRITAKGRASILTLEESRKIVDKWTERERAARNPAKRSS